MLKRSLLLTGLVFLSACSSRGLSSEKSELGHSESSAITTSSKDRLITSPRHQEWVEVKNGDKVIHVFVVHPERSTPAPVVLLIHENKGLNDWARSMADQVAEAGYIGVAPDLLSGFSKEFTRTSDFPDDDARTKAISSLEPESVHSDLAAVMSWAKSIPSATSKIVSAGFCWGGSQSFALAANSKDLSAALVFYGSGPKDRAAYSKISTPVFGFYGGADDRINATIPDSEAAMKAAGKAYDYVVYEGAGHAFMRLGEDEAGKQENAAARKKAWERMKTILSGI